MRLRKWSLLAVVLLCGCSQDPQPKRPVPAAKPRAPQPSPFDEQFWQHWLDGKAEHCSYRSNFGEITTIVRVDVKRVMHLTVRRIAKDRTEVLYSSLALQPEGRAAGVPLAASYSRQDDAGHSWAQASFGPRLAVISRHGSGQPDSTQTLDYYPPPFSTDGFLLWARRIAWPRIRPGARAGATVITSLSADERLSLVSVTLSRSGEQAIVAYQDRSRISFDVHPALPHYVKGWASSNGERAELIDCDRR